MNTRILAQHKSLLTHMALALLFVTVSVLLGLYGSGADLNRAHNALVTIPITIAIFAVNFSFLEYQFSPYRAVLRGISVRHVIAASAVLLLALTPIVSLYLDWHLTVIAGLVIPLVTYGSVSLALLARRTADPDYQLAAGTHDDELWPFLQEYSLAIEAHISATGELALSKPGESPTHEWSFRPHPSTDRDDPFSFAFKVTAAAVSSSDLHVFDRSLEALLRICDLTTIYRKADGERLDYKVQAVLSEYARGHLDYVAALVRETDKTGGFQRRYLDLCAEHLRKAAAKSQQCGELQSRVLSNMRDLAKHALAKSNYAAAMVPVVIFREVAQKGLDQPNVDDIIFYPSLCSYVNAVKDLGVYSVNLKNADFLYRCLDAAGYLGCSCVKKDNEEVGKACMLAIVQMGRFARRDELECFWDRCALTPWDHAEERLQWMLSWILKLDEAQRTHWVRLFSEAFSRLRGFECVVQVNGTHILIEESKKPHKDIVSHNQVTRVIDYSNFSTVKELTLY